MSVKSVGLPGLSLGIAVALQMGCASTGAVDDRAIVADGIRTRTGIDLRLPSTTPPGLPPDVSLADGLAPDEAVAIALWNNAAFQATLADLGIARADLTEARLLRNPILSLLFPLGPKQLETTLQMPVDAFWQRPRRVAAATSNLQAVAQRLINDGLGLMADVRLTYVDGTAADRRLALAVENRDLAARIAGIADARLRAGDISELEARAARSDAARMDAVRSSLEFETAVARVQLVSLLGIDEDPVSLRLEPLDALPAAECGAPELVLKEAMSSRPDVRAAELAIEAAARRASWERSRVVNLMGILDANGAGSEGFEAGPGVGADLPIFNQNQGAISRALAEVERASRQYVAVRTRVAADVRAAFVRLGQAQDAVRIWEQRIVPELEIERAQAENAYTAGEAALLAVLDVSRRLVEARTQQLEARINFQRAAVRLDYSVGRTCGAQ